MDEVKKGLTIKEMPINEKARLNTDQKKALVDIITAEFNRQYTRYTTVREATKDKIMEDYRARVGYYKLKKEYDVIMAKLTNTEDRIKATGLGLNGCQYYGFDSDKQPVEVQITVDKLTKLLASADKPYDADVRKDKVISRLWLSTTYAEAMVILREVLGNGDLPPVMRIEHK